MWCVYVKEREEIGEREERHRERRKMERKRGEIESTPKTD